MTKEAQKTNYPHSIFVTTQLTSLFVDYILHRVWCIYSSHSFWFIRTFNFLVGFVYISPRISQHLIPILFTLKIFLMKLFCALQSLMFLLGTASSQININK